MHWQMNSCCNWWHLEPQAIFTHLHNQICNYPKLILNQCDIVINTILSLFTCFNCLTHVWWLAGRRVTLQTRYFLRMVPQCVTSTFSPAHKQHNQTAITKHTHTGTHTNTHSPTQEHILTSKHTHKYTYTHTTKGSHRHRKTLKTQKNTTTVTQTHRQSQKQNVKPLISLVNLTLWESVSGRGCSSILWMSKTSHMNWITGCAL